MNEFLLSELLDSALVTEGCYCSKVSLKMKEVRVEFFIVLC